MISGRTYLIDPCGGRKDCNLEMATKLWWNWLCRRCDEDAAQRWMAEIKKMYAIWKVYKHRWNWLQSLPAAIYPGLTTTDCRKTPYGLDFVFFLYNPHKVSVSINLEWKSPHIEPDWKPPRRSPSGAMMCPILLLEFLCFFLFLFHYGRWQHHHDSTD